MKTVTTSLLAASALLADLAGQIQVIEARIAPNFAATSAAPGAVPAPPRGAFDQAPAKHGMPEIPLGNGPELAPGAPTELDGVRGPTAGGITVYRNTPVVVGSRSVVGEPTCAHVGINGIQTGNWYAATTDDDGQSWNHVNPYNKFTASDGGFCCDQYALTVPQYGMVVWLLQYGYSATTQTNRLRLAVMLGGNVGNATVSCTYDITPAVVGRPAGTWFDFPHMGFSQGWLYISANVFDANNSYVGANVMRLNLSQMFICQPSSLHAIATVNGSNRFVQRARPSPEMFFAGHASTSSLRIYTWPDNGPVSSNDVPVSNWYPGTTPVAGPDGRPFTNRADNRLQAGFDNGVHIGFMWYSNAGGAYPLPHVRAAWFDRDTLARAGERAIWNPTIAYAYPSAAPNTYGHIGGSIAYGGGNLFPSTGVFVVDDQNCWGGIDVLTVAGGTNGPGEAKWGDYYSTQMDGLQPATWLTTAMAMSGGTAGSNMTPRNVDFGRSNQPITYRSLDVRSVGVAAVPVTMTPNDNFCRAGGNANFSRWFRNGTTVSLSVPASIGGRSFYGWRVNGSFQTLQQTSLDVTLLASATAEAVYGDFTPGTATTFGQGCRGSGAAAGLTLVTDAPFLIGGRRELKLTNGASLAPAATWFGASNTVWSGVPLPFQLPPSNCMVYTDIAVSFGGSTNGAGQYIVNFQVPNLTNLIGSRLFAQTLVVDLFVNNPFRISTSNGLDLFVGGWAF